MKQWLIGALVAAVAATSVPDVAEAKRFGGGGSSGMQRSMPAKTAPNAPPPKPATPAQPQQAAPANGAAAGAAPAAATAGRSWMGPIAGLAAGLGIAALMSHLGLGEAFGNFLMLALLAVAAIFLVRFVMRRMGAGTPARGPALAEAFAAFFSRPDTFALGVCNGCQMMAALSPLIPGTAAWPRFTRNRSEQFEARLSLVEVLDSPSLFFTGMAGSRMPIAVAHGEGHADFSQRGDAAAVHRAMRFVDHHGRATEAYPANPNGSPGGLTAVTTADGRFTALMPHPERVFRNVQMSWRGDADIAAPSPWMRMFHNARAWLK